VKDSNGSKPATPAPAATGEHDNRRRQGRVVHDDRGHASVEWIDTPANEPRSVLKIEDAVNAQRRLKSANQQERTKARREDAFNPYQRVAPGAPTSGPRRDLRKLSEWIKMMRELEQRKAVEQDAEPEPTEE
jgi:hypothetical protein